MCGVAWAWAWQCVDFVGARVGKMSLSKVCEEVMDACLSDDPRRTTGIGGDNMTCIVVRVRRREWCVCERVFIFTSALTSKTFVAARDHKALSTLDAAGETKHSAVRYAPYDAELGPKGSCVSLACTRRRRGKSSFGRSNRRQAPRARRRKVCRRRVKNGTERSPSPSTRGVRLLWTNGLS